MMKCFNFAAIVLLFAQSTMAFRTEETKKDHAKLRELEQQMTCEINHDLVRSHSSDGGEKRVYVKTYPGDGAGLFDITVFDEPWAPKNGQVTHHGWCIDWDRFISQGWYSMDIYSAYDDSLPNHATNKDLRAVDKREFLPNVAWLINHWNVGQTYSGIVDGQQCTGKINMLELQGAIWMTIDDLNGQGTSWQTNRIDCVSKGLRNEAMAHGNGYVPNCLDDDEEIPIVYISDRNNGKIRNQVIMSETKIKSIEGMCTCNPVPTASPTASPTTSPTAAPTTSPTAGPTSSPTSTPTAGPTSSPTASPTAGPTSSPTTSPTSSPTGGPTPAPTDGPTSSPTKAPTDGPTPAPTDGPTTWPTNVPSSTPTEAPTDPPAPDQPTGDRSGEPPTYVKGDPHFKTFGGEYYDFHGECDLVLLHNPQFKNGLGMDIHIRTKIEDFWSSVESAAIAIGEDTLEIRANADSDEWLWINGQLVTDVTDGMWQRSSMSGFLVRYKQNSPSVREAVVYLENGGSKEKVQLKTFKSFVRIDLDWVGSNNYDGTMGLLGSYDHEGARLGRDGKTLIKNPHKFGQEWQVLDSEPKLFHSYEGAIVGEECKMPPTYSAQAATQMRLRKRRLAHSNMTEEDAEKACSHLKEPEEIKSCVYDVIATQDLSMASAW